MNVARLVKEKVAQHYNLSEGLVFAFRDEVEKVTRNHDPLCSEEDYFIACLYLYYVQIESQHLVFCENPPSVTSAMTLKSLSDAVTDIFDKSDYDLCLEKTCNYVSQKGPPILIQDILESSDLLSSYITKLLRRRVEYIGNVKDIVVPDCNAEALLTAREYEDAKKYIQTIQLQYQLDSLLNIQYRMSVSDLVDALNVPDSDVSVAHLQTRIYKYEHSIFRAPPKIVNK